MQWLQNLLDADWVVWFIIIGVTLFVLWLFFGGGDYEYVGLEPMKIGVDSNKYVDPHTYTTIYHGNQNAERISEVDITPEVPHEMEGPEVCDFIDDAMDSESLDQESVEEICLVDQPRNNKWCSKGEQKCREVMERIYGKPFPTVRPNFLKNPETGRNLELDCYNEELKIAVERHGIQHYVYPNYFHRTKEDFIKQIRRDQFKVNCCDNNGIYLITVPYNVAVDKIEEYIRGYLPQ